MTTVTPAPFRFRYLRPDPVTPATGSDRSHTGREGFSRNCPRNNIRGTDEGQLPVASALQGTARHHGVPPPGRDGNPDLVPRPPPSPLEDGRHRLHTMTGYVMKLFSIA